MGIRAIWNLAAREKLNEELLDSDVERQPWRNARIKSNRLGDEPRDVNQDRHRLPCFRPGTRKIGTERAFNVEGSQDVESDARSHGISPRNSYRSRPIGVGFRSSQQLVVVDVANVIGVETP